jgi:multidrug efflux system membrane fusion protein
MKSKFRRSYVWATLSAVAIVLWVASGSIPEWLGDLSGREGPATDTVEPEQASAPAFRVQVATFTSQSMPSQLRRTGRTQAVRRVEVRARTPGIVEAVPLDDGDRVHQGDLLCRLDRGARDAKLAEERARLASAEVDFQAADRLAEQKFASATRRAVAQAELDAARAAVESMEREIGYTEIASPIDGIVDNREAELGSFVQVGGLCATIIDLDPMLVVVHVGERDVSGLQAGMRAEARLVTGETAVGSVSMISPTSDEQTRTFRVEVRVPNQTLALRDGVTADLVITLPSHAAHLLPSSALTLNDGGQIGVRLVDEANTVRFVQVKILADGRDGIWVSGLPDTANVITVGQDYVLEGQTVEPVFASAELTQ